MFHDRNTYCSSIVAFVRIVFILKNIFFALLGFLTCNDVSQTRLKRLRYILKDYFTDIDDKVSVTNINGSQYQEETNFYNKVRMFEVRTLAPLLHHLEVT